MSGLDEQFIKPQCPHGHTKGYDLYLFNKDGEVLGWIVSQNEIEYFNDNKNVIVDCKFDSGEDVDVIMCSKNFCRWRLCRSDKESDFFQKYVLYFESEIKAGRFMEP